ncbi:MAG: hypothetical protein EBW90_11110, partial [Rhodobacteraceae bacterium]|nr:hypothetical protein [Paracoccaceae bacterium]
RSLVQCLRDVRQSGTISKGEQEYLEQIGANVGKVQTKMREFVAWEASDEAPWDSRALFDFIDEMTTMLADTMQVAKIRMDMLGLEEKVNTNNTYNEKVATNKSNLLTKD